VQLQTSGGLGVEVGEELDEVVRPGRIGDPPGDVAVMDVAPGSVGAKNTSAPGACAVNVFMKKDSPPSTLRFRPFITPPWAPVSIATVEDMASIAPPSALTDSP